MKILHIIMGIGGGGRERRMGQLVISLNAKKIAEQYILYFEENSVDYQEIVNSGAKLCLLKYNNRRELVANIWKTIKKIKPDIVHVWTEIPVILLAVSFAKLYYSFKLLVGFIADGNPVSRLYSRLVLNFAYNQADAIVSNSYAGLQAKGAIQYGKSKVIYNGFDFGRLSSISFDEKSYRHELEIKEAYVVCMAARFAPAKNWDMFLNVAEKVYAVRKDIVFLAIGDGPLLDTYRKVCAQRKIFNIKFLGHRSDVENLIRLSHVSLLFTNNQVHAEGVSNTIMETMAAKRPIIATAGGGTAEIVEDGENGYIIEPNDVEKAIHILFYLINHPEERKKISEAAYETIHSKFLLQDKTQEYINLYKTLLS